MKKNYVLILFLLTSFVLKAQVFSAGFENNNGTPLSEFKIVNNDSLEVPDWAEVPEFNEYGWIQFFDGPDNKIAFSTSFYTEPGASDDWLITPAIDIPDEGNPTLYWKAKSYDFEYMEDYDVRVSVTDNELSSFNTTLLSIEGEQPFDFIERQLDLSAYKGQTIYLAFVNITNEGYYLALDDLYISTSASCKLPDISSLQIENIDEQGFTVSWNADADISMFDVGLTTFDVPVSSYNVQSETTVSFSGLEAGTRYQFFLKNADCGSGWTSPISVRTAIIPPYSYDFEYTDENFGEYDSDGWTSTTWLNSYGGDRAQNGEGYIFNNTSTSYDSDAWIYSPAFKLKTDEKLWVTYYVQLANEFATDAQLEVVLSSSTDKSGHIEVIDSQIVEGSDNEYQEITATYIPTETGVYYIGFGNVTPQADLDAPLRLDNISFEVEELSLENHEIATIQVYPNPVQNLLNIESNEPIEKVFVYGIDGRYFPLTVIDSKVDFSALSDGIYFVKIQTKKGIETKKIIKH